MIFREHWRYWLIAFFFALTICCTCSTCWIVGYQKGVSTGSERVQAKWDKAENQREVAAREIGLTLLAISERFNLLALGQLQKQDVQREVIYQEVIKYVQKDGVAADVVDDHWLSLYNQSLGRAD